MRLLWACAVIAVAFLTEVVAGAASAWACSCMERPPAVPVAPGAPTQPVGDPAEQWAQAEIKSADAAFVGRLIKVRPVQSRRRYEMGADFIYRISSVYKGKRRLRRGGVVTVRSVRDEAACGLPDRIGRRYGLLLYRRKGRPRWSSGLCSLMNPRDMRLGASAHNAVSRAGQVRTRACS